MLIQLPSTFDAPTEPLAQRQLPGAGESTTLTVAPAARAHRWAEGKLAVPVTSLPQKRWQARVQVQPPGADAGRTAWTAQPRAVA